MGAITLPPDSPSAPSAGRLRLDYRAVWRWHFYAGLFAIPFVIWLSVTGALYLFKTEVDAWIDGPLNALSVTGAPAAPSRQVAAALAAVPGSRLNSYELPASPTSAARVLVGTGPRLHRVYVHPQTLEVLKVIREDRRLMRMIFYLHGELMLGDPGSMVVELASSWAIVLILTGVYLWWPRKAGFAGVAYPRLSKGGRVFWRDIHAVTAVWVSGFTLFLLISGLPWAKSWGGLLKQARRVTGETVVRQDWTTGRSSELEEREAMNRAPSEPEGNDDAGDHTGHATGGGGHRHRDLDLAALDRLVPTVAGLALPHPVLISPPSGRAATWTGKSDTPNRPQRVTLVLDGVAGTVTSRQNFSQRPLIDRLVGIGVAAHEGRLFGLANQLLGLFTAVGLVAACVSAVVLWWQRRPATVLGAPPPRRNPRTVPVWLWGPIVLVGLLLPLMGLTLIAVLGLEWLVLGRIPATRRFLGLEAHA